MYKFTCVLGKLEIHPKPNTYVPMYIHTIGLIPTESIQ